MSLLLTNYGVNLLVVAGATPEAPSINGATANGTSVTLTWVDNSVSPVRATSFRVENSTDGELTWNTSSSTSALTLQIDNLITGQTYKFRVVGLNFFGESDASNVVTLTISSSIQVMPSGVASALGKATANTSQWQSFKASLDAELDSVIVSTYYYDRLPRAADYALGYHCLKDSDPTTAANYAGKAIGLALSCARDSHRDSAGPWQFIGQGNGSNTGFTLPGTIVAGSLSVYLVTVLAKAVTKGSAGGLDDTSLYGHETVHPSKIVKLTATNDVTAAAAYAPTTDYTQGGYIAGHSLGEDVIDWSPGGSEPAPASTYYAIYAELDGNANPVNPANYSVVGTTLSFTAAPASNQAVVVTCLYHTGTLKYQQSGNGMGGIWIPPTADNSYPDRYFSKCIAPVLDWCNDLTDFSSGLKTELANALVAWSDISRDEGYAPANWIESNYGVGRYINRAMAAVAVQGRHAQDSRLKSEMSSLYASVHAKFSDPTSGVSSVKGGFTGEGLASYGQETIEHLLIATKTLGETSGWDLPLPTSADDVAAFSSELIQFLLHARYNESVNTQVSGENRPGSALESGDNGGVYPVPSPSKRIYAMASGMANSSAVASYARNLVLNKTGDRAYDCWDLMYFDQAGATADWTTSLGLTYNASGQGLVISRSAWDYASAWLYVHCGDRCSADHDNPGTGFIEVYRGNDKLLPNARAIGARSNPDGAGPWSNQVTIDDGGAQTQNFRWANTYVYSTAQTWTRAGVVKPVVDESNGHVFITADYKAIYVKDAGGTNPCTVLNFDVFFIPASGYVFRYDRVTTGSANYAKHLRYFSGQTSHPVGSGTVTLSDGTTSTSALPWNETAANVQTALRGLGGAGYSTCTVAKLCDGYWIVTFTAGTTVPAITGTASASGAVVEVYDYHPQGGAGARTIQHVVLAKTISGVQQKDVNTSRLFMRVDSSDTLTKSETLIDASEFGSNLLCRRLSFHPTSAIATVRFGTAMQVTTTATGAMVANAFLTGTGNQFDGYSLGQVVVLFRRNASVTLPDTINVTGSGTITWHVSGLAASTVYVLTGASAGTFTTNAYGVGVFTTTTTNPSVTIATATPPAAPSNLTATKNGQTIINLAWVDNSSNEAGFVVMHSTDAVNYTDLVTTAANATSYSHTGLAAGSTHYYKLRATNAYGDSATIGPVSATTDSSGAAAVFSKAITSVGMDAQLANWYAAEQARQGTSTPTRWWWQLSPFDPLDTGYPGLMVGDHNPFVSGANKYVGHMYCANSCNTPGGTMSFTDVTFSQFGYHTYEFGEAGGGAFPMDINGDGRVDFCSKTVAAGANLPVFLQNVDGTLTKQGAGVTLDGSNYPLALYESGGYLGVRDHVWPSKSSLISITNPAPGTPTIRESLWNGTNYTVTNSYYSVPSGVPQAVIDDCLSRLQNPNSVDGGTMYNLFMDLDDDGTDDLVLVAYFGYSSNLNFAYYLKNNGNGTYTDKTADWGLPRLGTFMPLGPYWHSQWRSYFLPDNTLQKSIDGSGTLCLFIAGLSGGYYKWNGTGYTAQTGDALNTLLRSTASPDDYVPQMYAVRLTNTIQGYDLIYQNPRNGVFWIYLNNGTGTFTRHNGNSPSNGGFYGWGPTALSIEDYDNDGKLDLAVGGMGDSYATSGYNTQKVRILKNTSSNIRNWIKVKLRRSTGHNPFGCGGFIEIYQAGTSTLLHRMEANPGGFANHMACGSESTVDVKVIWPSGSPSTTSGVAVNQTITVTS